MSPPAASAAPVAPDLSGPSDLSDPDALASGYDFDLPAELIAQRPAAARDRSRLMALPPAGPPRHLVFADLAGQLAPGDLLVRNDTRVFPARLLGRRPGGGRAELLLVRRTDDPAPPGRETWLALARPRAKLRDGMALEFGGGGLTATLLPHAGEAPGEARVELMTADGGGIMAAVERFGEVPLPPYIRRAGRRADPEDRRRYQTVYAGPAGAVAAPTAGLHFTPELDAALRARGIGLAALTLHVGPGTFRPVTAARLAEHKMDGEWFRIPAATLSAIAAARAAGGRVVAVGTTSARALETAAARGALAAGEPGGVSGWSELFIRPGYRFLAIDGLVTNFHLPRSSLLALVSALTGRGRLLDAYGEAVAAGYRFYSYGDAMLAWPGQGDGR